MASNQRSLFDFHFKTDKNSKNSDSSKQTPGNLDEGKSQNTEPPQKKQRLVEFNEKWQKEFLWLRTENSKDGIIMFCTVCERDKADNAYTKGCKTYQHNSLVRHKNLPEHVTALRNIKLSENLKKQASKINESSDDSLTVMLRTVYGMAKEEIPDSKFDFIMNLQRKNGVPCLQDSKHYKHHESIFELQKAVAETITNKLLTDINNSPFFGVIIDETVNISDEKKLIIYLRILVNEMPKSVFLANVTVPKGDAQTISDTVLEVLRDKGIDFAKCVGLGSDGAAVMTGRNNGVGVKLKALNPYLVHVHCCAHRAALAANDASKNVANIAEYKRSANNIFQYFDNSATRYERLRELNRILNNDDYISLKKPCSVRWLSLHKAVKGIFANWPSLFLELGEDAARGNAVAKGLSKIVSSYSFIAITCFLMDLLPIMDRLSLTFQKENVVLSTIQPMIESTSVELHSLCDELGEKEREFVDEITRTSSYKGQVPKHINRDAHSNVRRQFIQHLINSLDARFPAEQLSLLSSLDTVLNPSKYPVDNTIREHGIEQLQIICDYFANLLDTNTLKNEFPQVKTVIRASGVLSLPDACRLLMTDYRELFPQFSKLASIAPVIPVTSVPAERGFSCQNRIKDRQRSRLGDEHVDVLMLLSMEGPGDDNEVDFVRARQQFNAAKNRRL